MKKLFAFLLTLSLLLTAATAGTAERVLKTEKRYLTCEYAEDGSWKRMYFPDGYGEVFVYEYWD